jgi:shikimate dehydrogenase
MNLPKFDPETYAATKVQLGLIGSGIRRSLAPIIQEGEGQHHGLRVHYQIIDTADVQDPDVLPKLLHAAKLMGFAGLNITFPFKQAVLALLDDVDPAAKAMNAVNCVTIQNGRTKGYNTDSGGWGWGFARMMPGADLSRVVLMGCGGAGSAVAHAIASLGAKLLVLVDADAAKSAELRDSLRQHHSGVQVEVQTDIAQAMQGGAQRTTGLIHATPTGMLKLPGMALSADLLQAHMWVSDLVYVPLETELLKTAKAKGCATFDGGHMNVGQGFLNFKLFTGREPDVARMDAHFRSLVQV